MNLKALSLTLAVITLSGVAIADTVTTPAPSSTTASKSTYDWTGVYVGGFVGGAAGTSTNTQGPLDTDGNGGFSQHNAYSYDTSASFIGGGTVGYNWQIGKSPYLIGLEGEYGYLGQSGNSIDPNNDMGENVVSTKNNLNIGGSYGYGVVGGRIGYAMDRALFYVKSGAVFTNTQTSYNGSCPSGCGSPKTNHTSSSNNTAGYAIGGGVEYALPFTWSENISIKTEYLYLGINRTLTSVGNFDTIYGTYPFDNN